MNSDEMEQLHLKRKRQAKYYSRNAHDLPGLKVEQTLRMKPSVLEQRTWKKKAEVTHRLGRVGSRNHLSQKQATPCGNPTIV